ncbi:glycosyltransferase family 2 protein [Candidatus Woesearchaeota archaeon]|nr:glycosyltransferase family 2 protein [Candidatus Woesearchaeota archaeon]
MPELTVVIPVYNEEKNIEATLIETRKHLPGAKIIVVNDSSTDGSLNLLKKIKKKYSISIISHGRNRGYGAALKTGFSNAKTKFVAFYDADLTYHPKYVPMLLKAIKEKGLDCAWGNRFGGEFNQMPALRKIGNKLLLFMLMAMTFRNVKDCCSGERVLSKKALERISYETLPNGLDFISAMSKRILSRRLRFAVMPINYSKRKGSSKLNVFLDFVRMGRNILVER